MKTLLAVFAIMFLPMVLFTLLGIHELEKQGKVKPGIVNFGAFCVIWAVGSFGVWAMFMGIKFLIN